MTKKNSQNLKNIYVLPFKTMNHGSHNKFFLFYSYECKGIQAKNSLHKFFNLSFDLEPLKVSTYCIKKS
jgi:hypothetical protein